MPPRLLQRARRPDATPSGRSGAPDRPLELPPYEPPAYPMDERTKQKLASLSSSRETDSGRRKYEKHLTKSSTYLFESVGSINDVLFSRKQALAAMAEKRRARGVEDRTEAEMRLEEYVAQLEAVVEELTDSSEEALRWVIDSRAELEDQQTVLEMVLQGLNAQQPRPEPKLRRPKDKRAPKRRVVGGDDDEDVDAALAQDDDGEEEEDMDNVDDAAADIPPIMGVAELLEAARKAKMDEYRALSPHRRYALNNDYISFKKNWHDAIHPEDQVPLPDASTWFDEQGRPTKGVAADADEDEDLVVEREIIDLKCPLSLQIMKEPYSNHQCKHTFERSAIIEFIRSNNGMAKCPSCPKDLRIKDLYLDEVILRKIKRAQLASRRELDDTSDTESDTEADSSLIVGDATKIKKERGGSRHRLDDIDDD
ncbi:Zinc-finger of the MIZ type in Nse subunit-domain-containing protein [Madurella fahalii]|uniref:peptidylprolyl isomerase n=1 Tax=Madurella fahalii TaxID=1157608 RepID=A0ABQ0GDB1_9PEZI